MIMKSFDVDGDEFIVDIKDVLCLKETSRLSEDVTTGTTLRMKKYWLYLKYEGLRWELFEKEYREISKLITGV